MCLLAGLKARISWLAFLLGGQTPEKKKKPELTCVKACFAQPWLFETVNQAFLSGIRRRTKDVRVNFE
jgi:hypothetical protein